MSLRNFFLYLLIVSVSISALLGILVVILGAFSETELRILGTTTTITVLSILGLTSGAAYEARGNRFVSIAGIVSALVAAAIWILIIWSDETGGEWVAKTVMTATLLAFGLSYASLVSFARLDSKFEWARLLSLVTVTTLIGFLLYIIWIDNNPNEDFTARTIGSLSILLAALTVTVPILHILSKGSRDLEQIDVEILKTETRLKELRAERSELEVEEE